MIPKKPLESVLDKSIILTTAASNDNAKSISVQCARVQVSKRGQTRSEGGEEYRISYFHFLNARWV
jgi:hypothetical protein